MRIYATERKQNTESRKRYKTVIAIVENTLIVILPIKQLLQSLNRKVYSLFSDKQKRIYEEAQGETKRWKWRNLFAIDAYMT
jgi:hypothetical protein